VRAHKKETAKRLGEKASNSIRDQGKGKIVTEKTGKRPNTLEGGSTFPREGPYRKIPPAFGEGAGMERRTRSKIKKNKKKRRPTYAQSEGDDSSRGGSLIQTGMPPAMANKRKKYPDRERNRLSLYHRKEQKGNILRRKAREGESWREG